jgi:beta-lactamase superfamily II metal-dependent hydrolase
MIKLHVVHAEYGDCLILESIIGKSSTMVFIDGGLYQTFEKHLKPTIQKLPIKGQLILVILSHIDNDHINGLLDLLEEIKTQRESSIASIIMKGFQQATDLTTLAKSLKVPINPEYDKLILVDNITKIIKMKDMTFRILGPAKKNLEKLRKEWNNWLNKKKANENLEFELLQILDKSIPYLSSIMLLVESKTKKILFTGYGSGDDIIKVLSSNAMLDEEGKFLVDVLKVPHHGSDRKVSADFFKTVRANYYVISANGRDDNPSIDTLK